MRHGLDALLGDASASGVTLVTSFVSLEREAAAHRWTVMVRVGDEIRGVGRGATQEEALFEALEALHRATG